MPIIYCETIPIKPGIFEFIHSYYIGCMASYDDVFPYQLNGDDERDRLRAAIINVGLACRSLVDKQEKHKTVAIISDKDGRDSLYKGEHDALHHLLNPVNSREARKHRSLYSEYMRYLGRINELRDGHQITICLALRGQLVTYSGQIVKG